MAADWRKNVFSTKSPFDMNRAVTTAERVAEFRRPATESVRTSSLCRAGGRVAYTPPIDTHPGQSGDGRAVRRTFSPRFVGAVRTGGDPVRAYAATVRRRRYGDTTAPGLSAVRSSLDGNGLSRPRPVISVRGAHVRARACTVACVQRP